MASVLPSWPVASRGMPKLLVGKLWIIAHGKPEAEVLLRVGRLQKERAESAEVHTLPVLRVDGMGAKHIRQPKSDRNTPSVPRSELRGWRTGTPPIEHKSGTPPAPRRPYG